MRKIWDIPGGVHPAENKSQSNATPIGSIPIPKELILPLNQHIGAPAMPTVEVGDRVLKGQIIANAQGLVSAPVHASSSGHISAIEDRLISHPSGMAAPCIVIETDGEDRWIEREQTPDFRQLDSIALVDKIRNAGIAGLGGAGFPTAVKMRPRADNTITTLILNGTECEPYITADDLLMRERAEEVIAGAELFAQLLGNPSEILIGVEDNKPEAIDALRIAAKHSDVEVVDFPTKYPSGGEKQLIQILTGKEVPSGGIPAQLGIVVQNVGTAVAAFRAVRYGEPLVERVTTVVGESLTSQGNINVLIGTPIDHVLEHHGFRRQRSARLIIGGPMMGYAMEQTHIPVVKTTNCILVPSHDEMPSQPHAQPCIRCGMCAEACPASLLPQQLFWYAQAEEIDKLRAHNLFDCIECGACSFVCPSNIPLVQYYRASKGVIRKLDKEKENSDRSRERFEKRQQRIAKAEAEKEAKRLARKQAAEAAKKKLAAKKADEQTDAQSALATPDSPPTARPATKNDDPVVQRAKLERALSSATSRVERALEQLNKGRQEEDETRVVALEARLKQAEQKQSDAKAKLAAFEAPAATSTAAISEKVNRSPKQQQEKTISTLEKRIATAEQKLAEAKQSGASTVDALAQGVAKLRQKLSEAQAEMANHTSENTTTVEAQQTTQSAADIAIAKAQAKAEALASMSDEEKIRAQIDSLNTRLEKARSRLAKAQQDNSEHIDAFTSGVEKLEVKLKEAEAKVK